ncbi:hypothetical protein VKT23_012996 [Stygiomarasmius scandens]|uniref:non-specific serine/threonine protein kinase n=1 Tax=Marasmiellus scandens TaxID=2682957 RepID=A0ABR1J486_9AGAR
MSSWLHTAPFSQSEGVFGSDTGNENAHTNSASDLPVAITCTTETSRKPPEVQLTSFTLLIARLQEQLPNDGPFLFPSNTDFLNRSTLAFGGFFSVERTEIGDWDSFWSGEQKPKPGWNKYIALKYVRSPNRDKLRSNWKQLLLEARAFLHEPIRYHPNIVRFLAISWGPTRGSHSPFPAFMLELSELGTLAQLQTNQDQLSFLVKKQLCWDVSKGLSILHACGIIHGDLKHDDVLIYPNNSDSDPVFGYRKPYIAKLSDFGGSVMNLLHAEEVFLHVGTRSYEAPDARERLTEDGLKRTDVYSLGLLIWRTLLDGKSPFHSLVPTLTDVQISQMKRTPDLVDKAKASVHEYLTNLNDDERKTVDYVLDNTVQYQSDKRNLVNTIAALQAPGFGRNRLHKRCVE